jgi:6-phosphogluconolactonase
MTMTMLTPDPAALAGLAARHFASALEAAVEARGRFVVALAGGETPRKLYETLAGAEYRGLPWASAHVVFTDERDVPPDHPESNYRMARETLLDHVPVPAAQVHRFPTETTPPKEAAAAYERTLRALAGDGAAWPALDLALMGIGADGHTASLFPGSDALDEATKWVVAPHVAALQARRYTLTAPALAHAREMVFLAAGEAKAQAVADALEGEPDPKRRPAQRVGAMHGKALWLLDKAAARRLKDV